MGRLEYWRDMDRDKQALIFSKMSKKDRREIAVELLAAWVECVQTAIKAGDWKVDGACDPDKLLLDSKALLLAESM